MFARQRLDGTHPGHSIAEMFQGISFGLFFNIYTTVLAKDSGHQFMPTSYALLSTTNP